MKIFLTLAFCAFYLTSPAQTIEKTYLTTDKEIYAPEDTLWFKGYVFDQLNTLSDESISLHIVLSTEDGRKLRDDSWGIIGGLCQGQVVIPSQEGKYFLNAFSGKMIGVDEAQVFTKEIFVRSDIADEITLNAAVDESTNQVILNARLSSTEVASRERFTFEVWSDSERIDRGAVRTDTAGNAMIDIEGYQNSETDLSLLIKSTDNDLVNQVQLNIPLKIPPKNIDLQLLPEGGHLINQVSNRIAFKATDQSGKPYNFTGVLLDSRGNVMDSISSIYEGMGSFYMVPEDQHYSVRILGPTSFDSLYQLPPAMNSGIAMSLVDSENEGEKLLKLTPHPNSTGQLVKVSISQFEDEVFAIETKVAHRMFIPISLLDYYPGIVKVTLRDADGKVLSERLFFANPDEQLNIQLETDKDFYLPREKVDVKITVTNVEGEPVQGNFSLAAIDDTRSASPNPEQPHLMAQILLNSELRGQIPTPNYYFTGDSKAKDALDLVMLTHGWRRHKPSPYADPEALMGQLVQRNSKKKVIVNTQLSLISFTNFETESIPVDENGRFHIGSGMLKMKGDSFLLSSQVRNKDEKPNIKPNDSTRLNLISFKRDITSARALRSLVPDYSVYLKDNKVVMDRFQSTLILNTVTVSAKRYSENPCRLSDEQFEYPWKTKLADEMDLTDLNIVTLLKQVGSNVLGYGKIMSDQASNGSNNVFGASNLGTFGGSGQRIYPKVFAFDALLSNDQIITPGPARKGERAPNVYTTVAFAIYLNCKYLKPANNPSTPFGGTIAYDYQHRTVLESIDFRNIESISIKKSTENRGALIPPIIMINTVDANLIFKPRLQKFLTFATYSNEPVEFFKAKYETEEKRELPIPDLRTTIHWEPTIVTDNKGQASLSFYNADRPNRIRLKVEGVNNNSELGFAQKDYRVLSVSDSENK